MNPLRFRIASLLAALVLAACASPESRIRDNQTTFDSYPPQAQQKIRAGQIDVGFTPEMVRMALGAPDHVYQRTATEGSSEVWGYTQSRPLFSFGVGGGSYGGGGFGGGGVGVTTGGDQPEDKVRVTFVNGAVTAFETAKQ